MGGDDGAKLVHSPVEQGGDGAFRPFKCGGDFGERHTAEVVHFHGLALIVGELEQGIGHAGQVFLLLQLQARRRVGGSEEPGELARRLIERTFEIDIAGSGKPLAGFISEVVQEDAANPNGLLFGGLLGDFVPGLVSFEEGLLDDAGEIDFRAELLIQPLLGEEEKVGTEAFCRTGHQGHLSYQA